MSGVLAFLLGSSGGFAHHVHLSDGDGKSLRRLSSQRAIGRPDINTAGTHVAFPGPVTDDSDGRFGLYVVGIDGSGLRRLTAPALADLDPAWSPDGRRVAFVRQVSGAMDPLSTRLFTMPAGGGTASQVVSTAGARDPAWSPDGKRLAFAARGNLYLVSAGGGTPVVRASGGVRHPAWSPDGKTIAYVHQGNKDRSRLMQVPAGSGSPVARADHAAQVEDPRWSRDSKTIHYVVYRGQGYDGRVGGSIFRSTSGSSPARVAIYSSSVIRLGYYEDLPPGIIEQLLSDVTQRTVELTWTNPPDRDFTRAEVWMVAGASPVTAPASGTRVHSGRTPTVLVSTGIAPSTTYSFTVFAVDAAGNYSRPVSTTVTTPAPGVPGAPAHLEAVPGQGSARITWAAPLNDGGRPVIGYTVEVTGRPATVTSGSTRSVVVAPLDAGVAAAVRVVARNELGDSPEATTTVTPDAGAVAGTFTALAPVRVLDTRSGPGALTSSTDLVHPVAGSAGVPARGAAAVALSVTAVGPTTTGHLTVYPAGATEPSVSTLNFVPRAITANHDLVAIGKGGAVAFALSSGRAHVLADVAGFYAAAAGPPGGRLNAIAPRRLLDTRTHGSPLGGGDSEIVKVTGAGGVPATGVSAAVVVVTAVRPSTSTYLTVYPAGSAVPRASVVNLVPGDTTAVTVTAKLSPDGKLAVYNSSGEVHVLVDVVGYYTADATQPGEVYVSLPSTRVMDTRYGRGVRTGQVHVGEDVTLTVHGVGGVPTTARTVVLNLTATQPSSATYVTVRPSDRQPTRSSVLNVRAGATRANLVLAKLSPDGRVTFRNSTGAVHLIADVRGYFARAYPS